MPLPVSSRIGGYEIVSLIGAGAMGEVYRAKDTKLGRDVALKVLPASFTDDPDRVARFRREAQVLASLNHPHIAQIHGLEEVNGTQVLVLELVDGESLDKRIARGPIPVDEALGIARQIAEALEAAHEKGIIHRDLKPANIARTKDGSVKVLDFGLAKSIDATGGAEVDAIESPTIMAPAMTTSAGLILGTAAYMSPEQARGAEIDFRSDLFSFGALLYEVATGRQPFAAGSGVAVFESLLTRTPPAPSTLIPGIPVEFDRIVSKALEKDRDVRYQTAADLRGDLKRLQRSMELAALPVGSAAAASAKQRVGWKSISTAAAILVVAVIAAFFYSSRPRAFNERDWVVIADFANSTGNVMFDDTLKEALDVELRQSPFLSVLPDQRVQGTLRLMGRPPGEKLTADLARDLCQRAGSKAMIAGSISQLGRSYVISLDATNCRTGDTIDKRQAQAGSQEEVLNALATAAGQMRRGLGESLASIEKYDAPIENATTKSLDALKSYSLGMVTRRRQGDALSVPFFLKAIEQDPDFALAHARLGTVYGNLGEREPSRAEVTKAYALREKVSEPERLYIIARYDQTIENSTSKAIDTYRVWIQTYPNEFVPRVNLAVVYQGLGEWEKAAAELRAAISLAPDEPLPYTNLAGTYIQLRKLDEARKVMDDALANGLESGSVRSSAYVVAFFRHDAAEMTRQLDAARRLPDGFMILLNQATFALFQGQLMLAKELTAQFTSEAASKAGLKGASASEWSALAQMAALCGDVSSAHAAVRAALDTDRNVSTLVGSAFALASTGDHSQVQSLLDEVAHSSEAGSDDIKRSVTLTKAIAKWRSGGGIDALPSPKDDKDMTGIFMVGLSNLDAGSAEIAAKRFKQIMEWNTPSASPLFALAPLNYGRALVKLGRTDEARRAYEQFFDNWKSADANLPIVIAAKEEYRKLPKP